MASACVNNIAMSPENFLDCPPPSYEWLSPRISFSHEFPDDEASKSAATTASLKNQMPSENATAENPKKSDLEISVKDYADFEFRLEYPVKMLPADELFADGKFAPLQVSMIQPSMASIPPSIASIPPSIASIPPSSDNRLPDTTNFSRRKEISATDPYLFSPKAPTCSIRWKELLRLKKLYQNSNEKLEDHKTASLSLSSENNSGSRNAARSLKHLLIRSSKSSLNTSIDSSFSLPLLKESEHEVLSSNSRLSMSSSSSGHEQGDIARLSLDSDKPAGTINRNVHHTTPNLPRLRVAKLKHKAAVLSENQTPSVPVGRSSLPKAAESTDLVNDVSLDSPRMNSSGKIVFHNLGRSSSSPSTFNGGPRYKHRGVERSSSAKVRITPVLNVPVCSIRRSSKSGGFGFPLFSSQQKKDVVSGSRSQQNQCKNRSAGT